MSSAGPGAGTAAVMLLPAALTQADATDALRLLDTTLPTLHGTAVVVDGSALQRYDTSALAVLLACRRQALALGRSFTVRDLPPRLLDLAAVYGVLDLLAPGSGD